MIKLLVIRRISGRSMEPALNHGKLVLGTGLHGKLQIKQVVIVSHGGLEKIKRIREMHEDKIYVLGDNPDHSTDSRHFGGVTKENVIAKIIWPRTTSPRTYL